MNPSMFAALLNAEEDEVLGATPVPPALPAATAVVEPPVDSTPEQHILKTAFEAGVKPDYDAMESAIAPPSAPAAPAPEAPRSPLDVVKAKLLGGEATEEAPASEAKPSLRSLADKYGLSMEDMLPPMPRGNAESRLTSDIGRAGNTLGSALAGVKPDHSFYDNIEKRGAQDAAAMDARGDSFTKFKQALMLKVAEDGQKSQKNKLDYAQADAMFSSNPRTAEAWDLAKRQAAKMGIQADPDLFSKMAGPIMSQGGADDRTERGITARATARDEEHAFREKMMRKEMEMWLDKSDVTQWNKLQEDYRQAAHPHRAVLAGAAPPSLKTQGLILDADAKADEMKLLIGAIKKTVGTLSPVERLNPLENRALAAQYGLLRDTYRVWKNFGVPSGRDMEMIRDVVDDDRRFINIVSGRNDAALDVLKTHVDVATDALAHNYGYDRLGTGGASQGAGVPQDPRETVRKKLTGGQVGGNAVQLAEDGANAVKGVVTGVTDAVTGVVAPPEVSNGMVTPWGVPFATMEEKVINGVKKKRYLDAQGKVLKAP